MNGSPFFDHLETLQPEEREVLLFSKLPALLATLQREMPGWKAHLAGIDPASITSSAALAKLPVLRKSELT